MKIRNKVKLRKTKKSAKTIKRRKVKLCYASDEWASTSGICKNCSWFKDCGKVKNKLSGPKDIVTARCVL